MHQLGDEDELADTSLVSRVRTTVGTSINLIYQYCKAQPNIFIYSLLKMNLTACFSYVFKLGIIFISSICLILHILLSIINC